MSYGDFASHTAIDWKGHVGVVKYGDDSSIIAMFYNRSVHNPVKSAQAGTPIHDDVDYVRIQQPGERLNIIDRPVQPSDRMRFPREWQAYIDHREQIPEGTPIDLLFPAHPHVGANLRGAGVYTVEQCAKLSGHAMDVIGMGAQEYVNRANEYLDAANKGVGLHRLHKELEDRDSQIRVLRAQVGALQGQLDQLITAMQSTGDNPLLPRAVVDQALKPVAAPPGTVQHDFMKPPMLRGGRKPKVETTA